MAGVSTPTFTKQTGTVLTNLGPDGFTWAQAPAVAVDPFGKLVAQLNDNSQQVHFMYSNNNGVTWSTPTGNIDGGFLVRGSITFDAGGAWAHVLWNGYNSTDGLIYRRYAITRDGSNNITTISAARDSTVNLQLDFQVGSAIMNYELPVLLWIPEGGANGSLVAFWPAQNLQTGHIGGEVRCAMRTLTLTSADGTAANWVAPGAAATDSINNPPNIGSYTAVSQLASAGFVPGIAARRKAAGTNTKDLYVCYIEGTTIASTALKFRRLRWNAGSNNWSTGITTATTLTLLQRAGADALGYNLKFQLLTEPREDTARDKIWIGVCTYKDNTNRDTWGYVGVNCATDAAIAPIDVYSAGTHSDRVDKFIDGDISVDSTTGWVAVSYLNLTAKSIFMACYDTGGTQITAPFLVSSGAPFDTPTLVNGRLNQSGTDALVITTRDFNAGAAVADGAAPTYTPPYNAWIGRVVWDPPPGVAQTVNPGTIATGATVYAPTVSAAPVVGQISPNTIVSLEQVYGPTLRLQMLAGVIPGIVQVFAPSIVVLVSPQTIQPATIATAAEMYEVAFVGFEIPALPAIVPDAMASAERVYAPSVAFVPRGRAPALQRVVWMSPPPLRVGP